MSQTEIDFTGEELRDAGIAQAIESADWKEPEWSEKAYKTLIAYLSNQHGEFMTEQFRNWAKIFKRLSDPPSARAYGGIMRKAAKAGLIKKIGYDQVTNPTAHCANAAVWHKV